MLVRVLKMFLLFPCPFVFMFIVFEAQWPLRPDDTVLAALGGNFAVFMFFHRIYINGGSDRAAASINTALPKERTFVQRFGKALIYGAVFIALMRLLETTLQLSHLRAAVAALCGSPLFIELANCLRFGYPEESNQGEASLNTALQDPDTSSQSAPEDPYDLKEWMLAEKASKAMMRGIGFIVFLKLLEGLWQMSIRRATVTALCVTTVFFLVSLTYDRLHHNQRGKDVSAT